MDLLKKYLGEGTGYQIKREGDNYLIGRVELKTAKKIHGKNITKIDDKNKIVWVKKSTRTLDDIK